ncbi:MAG: hypothetical protein Q4D89_06610 [Arachnia propionica]|uniref:hypothetical protein n=1 Tax=Arachnia propionica TaxID=1750 RepID=UPI002702AAAE|nr:hypothetical protein [Arachnia propionica]
MSMMNTQQPLYHGSPPSRGGNGVVIALVVAIVVAVVGFGGWWFLGNQDSQQAQPLPPVQEQPQQVPPPAPSQGEDQPQQVPGNHVPSPDGQSSVPEQTQPRQEQPQPRQEQTQDRQGQTQEPRESEPSTRSTQGESVPRLPEGFGQFTVDFLSNSGSDGAYRGPDSMYLMVVHYGGFTVEDFKRKLESGRDIRDFYCRMSSGKTGTPIVYCYTEVHGGVVSLSMMKDGLSEEDLAVIGDELLAVWK